MVKIRLTQDCEHGERGKVFEVDEHKLEAFLAEGRCEVFREEETSVPESPVSPAPVLAAAGNEPETKPAPVKKPPVKKGKRR